MKVTSDTYHDDGQSIMNLLRALHSLRESGRLVEAREHATGLRFDVVASVRDIADFAKGDEEDLARFPELEAFNFNDCTGMATATTLNFVRLVERIRRAMAHEYGLPLSNILPLQAYSRKYVAGTTQLVAPGPTLSGATMRSVKR